MLTLSLFWLSSFFTSSTVCTNCSIVITDVCPNVVAWWNSSAHCGCIYQQVINFTWVSETTCPNAMALWRKVRTGGRWLSLAPRNLCHNQTTKRSMDKHDQVSLRADVRSGSLGYIWGLDFIKRKRTRVKVKDNCKRGAWVGGRKGGWGTDNRGDSSSDGTIDLVLLTVSAPPDLAAFLWCESMKQAIRLPVK